MEIRILGGDPRERDRLEAVTRAAVGELGLVVDLRQEDDPASLERMGVSRTPALVVDGTLVMSGRVPGTTEVVAALQSGS